ncbi:MAG: sodium:solute symporter family protein [Acidobacteriota bacterium]|nr:sodium:solute symporter family protein [Acidobacteriota bacterium]
MTPPLTAPAVLVSTHAPTVLTPHTVDFAVIVIFFVMVLAIGFYLKRYTKSGEDFFLAGREMTAWVAGLSFMSANLGSLELMGWAAATYEYGILAAHWYWIGAIPAMLFLAIVMMPFYYISRTHSVPGYLQLRFDRPTSGLSAICFAVMTILMSGVNMFAMAVVMKVFLGWNLHFSIWVSSIVVAAYVAAGGLFSAIFNEVVQFFLIWFGALLIPIIGLVEAGGWSGMVARIHANFPGQNFTHLWKGLGHFSTNPMGVNWVAIVFGLGMVTSMGYWTTDFLVVQRVMSAKDLRSAKMAPVIASFFKMAIPFIVILPGLLCLAVLPFHLVPQSVAQAGEYSYNAVLPLMLGRYCGPALLGLGITALIAGFMAGMAGNVSAFATVWTYDLYRPFMRKHESDAHYVKMGRWSSILGVLVSIGAAYVSMHFASIMDYVQALFSFFIAPLFGTVLLGMLWKRVTSKGAFWGLLVGTLTSVSIFLAMKFDPRTIGIFAFYPKAQTLAQDCWQALWACIVCVIVTLAVSYFTRPREESELEGLVYGCTDIPSEGHYPLVRRPIFWAVIAFAIFLFLQWVFW